MGRCLVCCLDCKEIKPVNPKGNQCWIFIGRTDAEAETPILWPPDAKNWLIWKDPDAGKDWRQEEEEEMTEDEMVGWHYWLDGYEFEQALGVGDGQGSLGAAVHGVTHNWVTELNWTDKAIWVICNDPQSGPLLSRLSQPCCPLSLSSETPEIEQPPSSYVEGTVCAVQQSHISLLHTSRCLIKVSLVQSLAFSVVITNGSETLRGNSWDWQSLNPICLS